MALTRNEAFFVAKNKNCSLYNFIDSHSSLYALLGFCFNNKNALFLVRASQQCVKAILVFPSVKPAKSTPQETDSMEYAIIQVERPVREDDYLVCVACDALIGDGEIRASLYLEDQEKLNTDEYVPESIGELCPKCMNESWEYFQDTFQARANLANQAFHDKYYLIQIIDGLLKGDEEARKHAEGYILQATYEADRYINDFDRFSHYLADESVLIYRTKKLDLKGFVYLLGSPEGYCKIGRTVNLSSRLLSIGLQLPFRVELLHSIKVSDPVKAERFLHQKFAEYRANGEWFLLSVEDINWIKSKTSLEGLY